MLLIGSHALRTGYPERKSPDTDLIGTFDELQALTNMLRKTTQVNSIPLSDRKTVLKTGDGRIFEFEIAWLGSPADALIDWVAQASPTMSQETFDRCLLDGKLLYDVAPVAWLPTLDQLYTLKLSHRYLKNSPHFRKTRDDIMHMRTLGAKVFSAEWLKARERETYVYKHPKLDVMKGDFFKGDGVTYVYEHDDIHRAVAHFAGKWGDPVPAYTLYMKDGAQVQCDKAKFFAVGEEVRLWGVLEEAQVLALERSQIPFRGTVDPRRSFDMALMKVCTSITSGWFREWAWENMHRVEALYEPGYVDRFWSAVQRGEVRKVTSETALEA